ncbi:hypothetical protein [Streptomyces sp. 8N706]|uniref:hypothetical protein n=1 Tax=Streptomyces sp. 8N706 TaxID=3457416 RepID=UPI003FD01E7C
MAYRVLSQVVFRIACPLVALLTARHLPLLWMLFGVTPRTTAEASTKGISMEIAITEGIVRRVRGGVTAPMTPKAIEARTIANFLPLACERAGAKIVHNTDDGYTGIRFETRVGPVVLQMPTEDGNSYRVIHEFIEPDQNGCTEKEIGRFAPVYKAQGLAFLTAQLLHSRGFLS